MRTLDLESLTEEPQSDSGPKPAIDAHSARLSVPAVLQEPSAPDRFPSLPDAGERETFSQPATRNLPPAARLNEAADGGGRIRVPGASVDRYRLALVTEAELSVTCLR